MNFFSLEWSRFLSLSLFCRSLTVSLCLSSSCFLCSLLSGSSQLSGSLSTFLSDSSSFCLVGLYLLSEESLCSSSFLVCLSLADLAILSIFLSLPSVETLLSFFLREGTLSYTTVEVLHEQYTFVRKDGTYGVSRLCTNAYPVQCAVEIENDCCRIYVRIERTETLDNFAVTRRAAVSYHDVVESVVFVTMTSQTNFCCHLFFVVLVGVELREFVPG